MSSCMRVHKYACKSLVLTNLESSSASFTRAASRVVPALFPVISACVSLPRRSLAEAGILACFFVVLPHKRVVARAQNFRDDPSLFSPENFFLTRPWRVRAGQRMWGEADGNVLF
jgi:hypothetical protein